MTEVNEIRDMLKSIDRKLKILKDNGFDASLQLKENYCQPRYIKCKNLSLACTKTEVF